MKNKGFCFRIWPLYDVKSFTILIWYVSIPLLQVVVWVAFSKCFNAFINTIVVFMLKNTERKSFTFSRLVLINKSIFSYCGEYVFIWFGISWSKKFLPSTSNIRLLKGKSVTNVFMTAFHKVKLNPAVIKLLTSGNFYQHLHFFSPNFVYLCYTDWFK